MILPELALCSFTTFSMSCYYHDQYLRHRLPKRDVGVVAEGHDASIEDLLGMEIRTSLCPSGDDDGVATEAAHSNHTKERPQVGGNRLNHSRSQPEDLQAGLPWW